MRRAGAVHRAGTWPSEAAVGTVTLAYDQRHRRRIRLARDDGEDVLLDLPEATVLRDGDGLALDGGGYLAVRAAPEALLEVRAAGPAALARLAWHLGNRHLPAAIDAERILIRDDHVIAAMLRGLGAAVRPVTAAFDPESGAYAATTPHDGGHHGHHHHPAAAGEDDD